MKFTTWILLLGVCFIIIPTLFHPESKFCIAAAPSAALDVDAVRGRCYACVGNGSSIFAAVTDTCLSSENRKHSTLLVQLESVAPPCVPPETLLFTTTFNLSSCLSDPTCNEVPVGFMIFPLPNDQHPQRLLFSWSTSWIKDTPHDRLPVVMTLTIERNGTANGTGSIGFLRDGYKLVHHKWEPPFLLIQVAVNRTISLSDRPNQWSNRTVDLASELQSIRLYMQGTTADSLCVSPFLHLLEGTDTSTPGYHTTTIIAFVMFALTAVSAAAFHRKRIRNWWSDGSAIYDVTITLNGTAAAPTKSGSLSTL